MPQTNGMAENWVRKVKEGTSCCIEQSGVSLKHWDDAMRCYTFSRNITDINSLGCTSYKLRFGKELNGKFVPFGALVEYMSLDHGTCVKDHPVGKKTDLLFSWATL